MNRRTVRIASALAGALLLSVAATAMAVAAGPARESNSYTERFFDDFIHDLCGVSTTTTLVERWTWKEFADGSATLHVVRTYFPDDPRIPIEKAAATSFFTPEGTQRVVGKPIHLISQDGGGTTILDAGWIEFGEQLVVRGPHPSFDVDLAAYYCP